MSRALRALEIVPDLKESREEARRLRARRNRQADRRAEVREAFRDLVFEKLSSDEKDRLLKELAILAGLIDDSDDEE